ncbi:DUF3954 domain-containing protein [Sporosarcina sp. E16_8]|uniref:DUF3954 domain-containing protein n=1 Tax=Sporosarcina sp. E16_8 TaxID=2789295 RepID=UPI002106BDFB|nr:DUF3954 domain-containing protein [Sporosarcina sp. E16_8]
MEMVVNIEKINLLENATYVVKDGKIEKLGCPQSGYGKQTVLWQNGKPVVIEVNCSKKI